MAQVSMSSFLGSPTVLGAAPAKMSPARTRTTCTRALQQEAGKPVPSRRSFGALLGAALIAVTAKPPESRAAYGEAARVFGSKPTNATGFIPYRGGGFSMLLPARWEPTAERDDVHVKLRIVDTYPSNNMVVYAAATDKKSVADFGGPDKFLKDFSYLFGDNVWQGNTRSEGGFKANQVSSASILEAEQVTGKDGVPHINAHVLIRSADGNEGGRHHIISAAVADGKLYIMKAQIGDKRWNKGGSRDSKAMQESFAVA